MTKPYSFCLGKIYMKQLRLQNKHLIKNSSYHKDKFSKEQTVNWGLYIYCTVAITQADSRSSQLPQRTADPRHYPSGQQILAITQADSRSLPLPHRTLDPHYYPSGQ